MGDGPNPSSRAADLFGGAAADLEAARAAITRREPGASVAQPNHESRLRDVMRLARDVTSILELQPLLDAVVLSFVEITGAERGFLMLYDDDRALTFRASHELDHESWQQNGVEISRGPIREAAESGRGVYVDDVLTQGQYGARESILSLKLRSFSCVPLVHRGRVLGVCYTDSRHPGRPLDAHDRGLLEAFASQAALAIENAREHDALMQAKSRLEAENQSLRRQIERSHRFANILGESEAMQKLFDTLEKVVPTTASVLLIGETGTGKELIARAIHSNGPLKNAPFIPVNVAALPEALLESELFGHKRGAFTGAIADRAGLFESADGGTLFLDEIGDMPLQQQSAVLRALQEGEVRRVGEERAHKVRVRVIAATNRDLTAGMRDGRFREDLYYRLNVIGIQVPPLRQRGNDILLLAEDAVRHFSKSHGKKVAGISPSAARWLLDQRWPGNVRQLLNCVERAVTLCEPGRPVDVDLLRGPWSVPEAMQVPSGTLKEILDAAEGEAVRLALEGCAWQVTAAARQLGVSRQHLHNLVRKHSIDTHRARRESNKQDVKSR
jgi:transcriptional regulator with GAF, ATPase, and Fis domain